MEAAAYLFRYACIEPNTQCAAGMLCGMPYEEVSALRKAVTVDTSGTSLRLRVTGAGATTIDWTARWVVG